MFFGFCEIPQFEIDLSQIGALVPAALRVVAPGGSVICAGIHMSDIPSFPYALLWGERTVRSVANLTRRDGEELLELAAEVPLPAIDHVFGGFEFIDDGRGGQLKVNLTGKINRCGAITPRFSVQLDEMEYWEKQYLPGKNFGLLMLSTSRGVISHEQARKDGTGGELIGYVY